MNEPVSFATLKTLIEADSAFQKIAAGNVSNQCDRLSWHYSQYFKTHAIDHVVLEKEGHLFMAVRTADRGILIFEPTIKQFYPDFSEYYFLDTPEKLHELIMIHGGMDAIVREENHFYRKAPMTARDAYINAKIIAPLCPMEQGKQVVTGYMSTWVQALHTLAPNSHIFKHTLDRTPYEPLNMSPCSSSEVSP